MKASDKPEISKKWWTSEKPNDIKGADLEKALAAAEKSLADVEKKDDDAATIKAALDALSKLSDVVDKTIKKECDKKKHKDVITVLDKYKDLIGDEREELEESLSDDGKDGGEEDEEDDKGVLKEEYLDRMIKMLRSGKELQFCFGLNKTNPEQSRLVLCIKRKPERLFKILKQTGDFSNRLMTFGTAIGDGKLLQFNLSDDAKEPSQIVKIAKQYLKSDRKLKFKKLRVVAGGQTFEEDLPEGEEGAQGAGDLQQRLRSAQTAELTWKTARETITDQIAQVQRELNAFDDPSALSVKDGLSKVLDKVQEPDFSALARSKDVDSFTSTLEKTRQRIVEWRRLVGQGGALQAIDENPFVRTDIVGTVNKALSSISSELQIA